MMNMAFRCVAGARTLLSLHSGNGNDKSVVAPSIFCLFRNLRLIILLNICKIGTTFANSYYLCNEICRKANINVENPLKICAYEIY